MIPTTDAPVFFWITKHEVVPDEIVRCFAEYMTFGETPVTQAQFEESMTGKMRDALFLSGINPLLQPGLDYDVKAAGDLVHELLFESRPPVGGLVWLGFCTIDKKCVGRSYPTSRQPSFDSYINILNVPSLTLTQLKLFRVYRALLRDALPLAAS